MTTHTACKWKPFLLNVLSCASWCYKPVCRCIHTACNWTASLQYEQACTFSDYQQKLMSSYTSCGHGGSLHLFVGSSSWKTLLNFFTGQTPEILEVSFISAYCSLHQYSSLTVIKFPVRMFLKMRQSEKWKLFLHISEQIYLNIFVYISMYGSAK